MAYASDTDLTTRIPATTAATSDQRALALADAEAMIDDERFDDRTVRAHCFLAAHYLVLGGIIPGGEGGLVTSRSAGAISVSYAAPPLPAGMDPNLLTTTYGRQFLAIANTVACEPIVA